MFSIEQEEKVLTTLREDCKTKYLKEHHKHDTKCHENKKKNLIEVWLTKTQKDNTQKYVQSL